MVLKTKNGVGVYAIPQIGSDGGVNKELIEIKHLQFNKISEADGFLA